jgi:hypothetical protein
MPLAEGRSKGRLLQLHMSMVNDGPVMLLEEEMDIIYYFVYIN